MSVVELDGLATRFEKTGDGPPLLMLSPGGFGATVEAWSTLGRYRELHLLDSLAKSFTCITFDRCGAGRSAARVERLTWRLYVRQALALLDHLQISQADLLGGCVGCSIAAAVAAASPRRVRSMVLFSPAGGPRYRILQHRRFTAHRAFVAEHGLQAVVDLARSTDAGFSQDPRLGPWAAPLRNEKTFATAYARLDPERYDLIVAGSARGLFDRDTVPGIEPEDLMRLDTPALIVPGNDRLHAPSAACYLRECLPVSEYWDVPVAEQTATPTAQRILQFLPSR